MKRIFLLLIRVYQKTLSLDHGILGRVYPLKACRFYPSCSQYTYEVIDRFGVLRGMRMGLKRIVRCRPGNPGGYDPIPKD